jgi:hypothetical protein
MTASAKHLVVRLFNAFGLDIRRRRPATPAQRQLLDRQLDPLLAEAHEKHS